jgi:hypothetical protein
MGEPNAQGNPTRENINDFRWPNHENLLGWDNGQGRPSPCLDADKKDVMM